MPHLRRCAASHQPICRRVLWVALLAAVIAMPPTSSRAESPAHQIQLRMNGFDAVSKIIAPVFVKYDCYGKDRSALVQLLGTESHPQLDALCYSLPVRTGVDMTSKFDWKCRLVDGEPGTGAVGIDEALAAQDEN